MNCGTRGLKLNARAIINQAGDQVVRHHRFFFCAEEETNAQVAILKPYALLVTNALGTVLARRVESFPSQANHSPTLNDTTLNDVKLGKGERDHCCCGREKPKNVVRCFWDEHCITLERLGTASKGDGDLVGVDGGVVVLALFLDGFAEVAHEEGAINRIGIDHNGDPFTKGFTFQGL